MMVHVPAILLSAVAEFDQAYDKGGNIKPKLSQISEDDPRAKSSSWYQPPVDARRPGITKGTLQANFLRCTTNSVILFTAAPIIVVKQPWGQKPLPFLPFSCDSCQNRQKVCRMSSILSCDACYSDQILCTVAAQPLA
jgi:hypothetical protein